MGHVFVMYESIFIYLYAIVWVTILIKLTLCELWVPIVVVHYDFLETFKIMCISKKYRNLLNIYVRRYINII